jgi:hypothetical protein
MRMPFLLQKEKQMRRRRKKKPYFTVLSVREAVLCSNCKRSGPSVRDTWEGGASPPMRIVKVAELSLGIIIIFLDTADSFVVSSAVGTLLGARMKDRSISARGGAAAGGARRGWTRESARPRTGTT